MAVSSMFALMTFATCVQAPFELSGYTVTTASPPPLQGQWPNNTLVDVPYTPDYEPLVWQGLLGAMASMVAVSCFIETYLWFRSCSSRSHPVQDDPPVSPRLTPRKTVRLAFSSKQRNHKQRHPKQRPHKRRNRSSQSRTTPKIKRARTCAGKPSPFKGMHVRFGPNDLVYASSMRAVTKPLASSVNHSPLLTVESPSQVPSPSCQGPTMVLSPPHTCLDLRGCGLTHAVVGTPHRALFFSIYFPHHHPEDLADLVLVHWPSPAALLHQKRLLCSHFVPTEADLVAQRNRLNDAPVPFLTWDPFKDRVWYVPPQAIKLREHLAKVLMERHLWPSHIRFTLDPQAPYDLGFFPGLNLLSSMVGGPTLNKICYEAGGEEVVTVTRPHGFPTLMVYRYT